MNFVPEITTPLSNPVLIFAVLMALIFIAPQVVQKLKIPGIVGLILAGALVGPSGLHLLEHNPDTVPPDFMGLLGMAGLMYLMFQAGLSLDLARFIQLKGRSLTFGLISFFVPQIATVTVAFVWLGFSIEAALLLGSIIGSHTLIAYPIAARLGLIKNTAVTMTLGGTLVTDTLSLTILAIVVAWVAGDPSMGYWATFAFMVALFVFLVLWGLPRLGYLFFRTVQNRPEIEFGFLLTVLFVTAWLAEFAGLAPIIGAFVAGLAMNRMVPGQGTIMARMRFVGEALFIPFFMIYVGLLIDVAALFEDVEVWILAATLIALVSIGKLVAAKVVQHLFDYTAAEGWVSYGLSVPQAAATLAVTLVGFEIGLFDPAVVNAVVVMILVSCIIGSTVVEKFGLEVAHQMKAEPTRRSGLPERILVPLANPKTSQDLMELAVLMRDPDSEEPILPMMVVREEDPSQESVQSKREELDHAVEAGAEAQVPVEALTRIDLNAAHGIARAAREERATLLIIGWSGRVSTRERIFGSVLDQLLAETKQMIFVNRILHPLNTVRRVVLTIPPFAERSPGFFDAIHDIKLMASRLDADLEVVCVERYMEHDRNYVDSTEPQMEVKYSGISHWGELTDRLDEVVEESTLILSMSARPGTAAWFPALDGMPRVLAARYSENSFSVVFLSEQ